MSAFASVGSPSSDYGYPLGLMHAPPCVSSFCQPGVSAVVQDSGWSSSVVLLLPRMFRVFTVTRVSISYGMMMLVVLVHVFNWRTVTERVTRNSEQSLARLLADVACSL